MGARQLARHALEVRGPHRSDLRPGKGRSSGSARVFNVSDSAGLALDALPVGHRFSAFFDCWTRKEAYARAEGEGLRLALRRLAVSLAPGEPARAFHAADDPGEARGWRLEALDPAPRYATVLAPQGRAWRLRCWRSPSGCACEAGS